MNDVLVIAKNPAEMATAQADLSLWASNKVAEERIALDDLTENLEHAKKHKWKESGFRNHVSATRKRLEFYEKIKAAIDAGYHIIPNFDMDVFAVRTAHGSPRVSSASTTGNYVNHTDDLSTERPRLGDGRYVSIRAEEEIVKEDDTDSNGKSIVTTTAFAEKFQDVVFPFSTAKVQILDETSRAMALKCFDEMGCLPAARRVRGDPMIIGRISRKSGSTTKAVSFLITWFINTKDL